LAGYNVNASALLDIIGDGSSTSDSSGNTFGWSFHVTDNISIAALGVWDGGDSGLNHAHEVGLWNSSGTLLANVTIYSGVQSTLQQGFRYENLPSSVALASGSTYFLGALYAPGDTDLVQNSGTYEFLSSISFDQLRYSVNDELSFPNLGAPMNGFFGPNASLTAVPESGTTGAIVGLGVFGFILWQRKYSS